MSLNRSIPMAVRAEVLTRDGYSCQICKANVRGLEIHHIVPVKFGGKHNQENLITLCKSCHRCVETNHVGFSCRARLWKIGNTVDWFHMRCHELGLILPANQHQVTPYYHRRVLNSLLEDKKE